MHELLLQKQRKRKQGKINLPIFAELDDACFKSQLEYAKQHKMLREGWEVNMK